MRVETLKLTNFRNYNAFSAEFDPGVNLIVGKNAQGKTNLLEAISFLGTGKSFRAQKQREMIQFDQEFADIFATVFSQERQQTLRWCVFSDSRRKRLEQNGIKKRSAEEISGVMSTVLFCPEDLFILKAGASARRKLGDSVLCQLRSRYDAALSEYQKLLEEKSKILKEHREYPGMLEVLPEFNLRLCQIGGYLISYRARFYESLGKEAANFHSQFSGGAEAFSLKYQTVSTVKDPFAPMEVLVQQLQEHMESHTRAELESAQCLSGPHKDDFTVSLSGMDLKTYGSQGQTRTAAISLKLAQRELMKREAGEEPVLLLDDVLSELDPGRQDFVLNQICSGQVFITCCEPGRFTKLGKTVEIESGNIKN